MPTITNGNSQANTAVAKDSDIWLTDRNETVIGSNYYESPAGEPNVDDAWGEELDDPATRTLAEHTFRHIARGEASKDDGEEITSIIAASFGTKSPAKRVFIPGPDDDSATDSVDH